MFERLKNVLGFEAAEDTAPIAGRDFQDDAERTSLLSWDLRIQCFIGTVFLSIVCSFLGSVMLFAHKITGFTVMVSVGNVISILGTCFLTGPSKQLRNMFERGRFIATLMYIVMIVLAFVAGLVLSNPPLALIFVIGQYAAMLWYTLSYIPFAREVIRKCFCSCFG